METKTVAMLLIGIILMILSIFLEHRKDNAHPIMTYVEPILFLIGFALILAGVDKI